jgi:hypothetical protein
MISVQLGISCDRPGNDFKRCVYATDPSKPIGDWKEAWEAAKKRAGAILERHSDQKDPQPLVCRFHDVRHTACTRMLERAVPFSVVATVMGWSPSTSVRMARRYGHLGESAQREAVQALNGRVLHQLCTKMVTEIRLARGCFFNSVKRLAPRPGLEPGTLRLTAECSTIELPRKRPQFRWRDSGRGRVLGFLLFGLLLSVPAYAAAYGVLELANAFSQSATEIW